MIFVVPTKLHFWLQPSVRPNSVVELLQSSQSSHGAKYLVWYFKVQYSMNILNGLQHTKWFDRLLEI